MGRIHLRVGVVAVAISAAIFCHANAIAADTKIPLILADDSGTETSARQSAITLHDQGDWDAYDNAVAIAKKNMMGAPDAALEKAQDAENIVRGFPNSARQREALATSLWLQAESITRLNRPVESAPLIAKAFTYISEEVSPLSGDLLLARGRNARILGDVARALESFQAANGIFAKLGNARKEAIALQSIGTLYANARLYDRVIEYYSTASRVFSDDATLDLSSFNNRANAYRELGSFDEARRLFDASLEMAQALESDMLQARILTNIATLETRRGNFIAAESAITQAVEHAQIDGARGWLPLAYGARAELALAQNDFNGSLKALDAIFSEVDIESTSTLFRDTHKVAYKVHKALGEHEVALQHLESFKRHDDNGRDLATSANLALLNAEFEFAKQKFEIAKLRSEQLQNDVALADVRERLRNAINIGLLAGGALLLVFFGLAAKSARRSERMTSSLNRKLESKNEELIVTNTRLEKANQAKMEFLAATSHEIRTPLNAIIGLTDVMLNGEAIIERDRGYLKLVNSSGKNLLNIVNDILDISKLEANRIEVKNRAINITDGLLDVAGLWRRPAVEKGLLFDVQISSDPIYYHCDDRLLRQILSNLISNAIKFTSEGSITISLRNLRGDSFTLAVSDTGIGIAQENHESIFETFQQIDASLNRNYEGTGLGLAICKKIAEALGGGRNSYQRPRAGLYI